jgi:acetyltransferase-like isoleucine patch superfamily enzyme
LSRAFTPGRASQNPRLHSIPAAREERVPLRDNRSDRHSVPVHVQEAIMSISEDELTVTEALAVGLLITAPTAHLSRLAVVCPTDDLGDTRPVTIGPDAVVGPGAVLHGGTTVAARARVESHAVLGQPERGYALRRHHHGEGASTTIGARAVVRAGAILYAGVQLGDDAAVGHNSVLRSHVQVGAQTSLGHLMTIERQVRIGDRVRCSPGSHLTAETVLEDEVFLGAGVRTINDKVLSWRPGGAAEPLAPPHFAHGARVGSGAVILGGIRIGVRALVGAGAVVTRDVDGGVVVVGNPARPFSRQAGAR